MPELPRDKQREKEKQEKYMRASKGSRALFTLNQQ